MTHRFFRSDRTQRALRHVAMTTLLAGLLAGGFSTGSAFAEQHAVGNETKLARGIPKPLAGHPGNIFLGGEEVTIPSPQAEGATGWECLDYDRHSVAKGDGATARLGTLPVGYYEVWATGKDGQRLRKTTIAVLQPLAVPTPDDSPIAVDAATAWFYNARDGRDSRVQQAANHAALAGINWIRDRLLWEVTEPARGKFAEHTIYDETARQQAAAGLKALQVIHATPSWANEREWKRFPHDLRDAYRYFKTMSARWRGQVRAWEPWNEADIDVFGGHTGAEIATYQKAAYFALRAGNPEAIVCQNVFALGAAPIRANFQENEPWPYFDTFNFHHYSATDAYEAYYAGMRETSGGRPLWVTEAGTHVPWEGEDQEPSWESQQRQARFVLQCLAASVAQRSAATFYFLLPHYVEGKTQFGLTHKDLTPRPSYVALAAAGRLLAAAKPLGRLAAEGQPSLRAYVFRAKPDGKERIVVVAWSQQGQVAAPSAPELKPVAAFDFLGRSIAAPGQLGIDPVYLLYEPGAESRLVSIPAPTAPKWKEGKPCPVVIQALIPAAKIRLSASAYVVPTAEGLEIPVYVYNFSDQPVTTKVEATAGAPLEIAGGSGAMTIQPLDRAATSFRVSVGKGAVPAESLPVRFQADCGPLGRSLTVLRCVVAGDRAAK